MTAAVLEEPGAPLVVEELEPLPPDPHEVIVRTSASPFCVTDCFAQQGALGPMSATILGHAACGVVEEVGALVDGLAPGQRVVVPGTPECGACYWCVRGRADQCQELWIAPIVVARRADGSEVTAAGGVGGYAETMKLRAFHVVPVHTDLPDDVLSLMGCGITSGLGAVFNTARLEGGASAAVVGCGHLGLWMIQAARVAGATQIIAVEPRADRRELAGELGATHLVDPADGDPVEQVHALTDGRGTDYGFEAAGPPDAMLDAFLMTRRAGIVVLTGVETATSRITFPSVELALGGREIRSCQNGTSRMRRDIPRYVRMLEDGVLDPARIITRRYPLEQINDAMHASQAREDLTGVIVLDANVSAAPASIS